MTDIEQKALALLNGRHSPYRYETGDHPVRILARAIEQHEAFRQEVSDACNAVWDLDSFGREQVKKFLSRFIIAKPDPLVEALNDMKDGRAGSTTESYAACLRAAMKARGYEWHKIEGQTND